MASPKLVLGGLTATAALLVGAYCSSLTEARSGRALVPRGDFLVVKRSGLQVVDETGRIVRRLDRFRGLAAVEGMAISRDRRHAFVSINRADRAPQLMEVDLATGRRRKVANAVNPAVSPVDGRLAYLKAAQTNDIVFSTALVVRSGSGPPHEIPMGTSEVAGGPGTGINWSPDGRRIAIPDEHALHLVDPATATSVASQPAVPRGGSLFAPAFLSSTQLVGVTNCCIGSQRLAVVDPTTGKRTPFAVLPAALRTLSRVRPGVLVAVNGPQQLVLIRKGKVQIIGRGVFAAAT